MNFTTSVQTIAWINGLRNDHDLEISPAFQTRAVWLERERSELAATIIDRLPFPEIYLQVTAEVGGTQRHVVVDGQQRVTSILGFIDGEFGLPRRAPFNGAIFPELDDDQRGEFWNYQVVVRLLHTSSDAEIRELFKRVKANSGVLTSQEVRNARFVGKFKEAAERLADNPFFSSINLFTAREVRRLEDIEFVSELLLVCVEGITHRQDLLDAAYLKYEGDFPEETVRELEFNIAMQMVASITDSRNAALIKAKTNFYSLFAACLETYRTTESPFFSHAEAVKTEVTTLLALTREFDPQQEFRNPLVDEYHEAATRSASDKSQRMTRHAALMSVMQGYQADEPLQARSAPLGR